MSSWPQISIATAVGEVAGVPLAVMGIGPDDLSTLVYLEARPARHGKSRVSICDTATRPVMPQRMTVRVDDTVTLAELLLAHAQVQARVAARVPKLAWGLGEGPGRSVTGWLIAGGLVSVFVSVGVVGGRWDALAIGSVTTAVVLGAMLRTRRNYGRARSVLGSATNSIPPTVVDDSGRELLPSAVKLRMPAPELMEGSAPTPAARVAVIRAIYERLRDDIVYRIENSALFDASFPPTQRFEVALLRWDPHSQAAPALAGEVERSFRDARVGAEQLGYDHLPASARDTARRATSAAQVALTSDRDDERSTASRKVAELLASLSLYYLPRVDATRPGLVGVRRTLEGPS